MCSPLLIETTAIALLQEAGCTLCYRFNHIYAHSSHDGREYFICCLSETAMMTQDEFRYAIQVALSFRLRERTPENKIPV